MLLQLRFKTCTLLRQSQLATGSTPNRRSYIRLAVIRSLLMGSEHRVVAQQFCRTDRVVRVWIEMFNAGGIDALTTKGRPGRGRRVMGILRPPMGISLHSRWRRRCSTPIVVLATLAIACAAPPGSQVPAMPNDLGSLIDHGLSRNPATRKAWFEARAAAAAVGEARAPYYPRVSTRFEGGSDKWYTPPATGPDNYTRVQATPILSIEYLLLDFGRRSAEVRRTLAILDAAGLAYKRKLQEVVFKVQSAYFAYEASLRRAEAARALVEASRAAAETVEREVKAGLAAVPELQLVKRNLLKAEYDREAADVGVKTTLGDLCVAAGLPANTPLQIAVTEPPVSTAELRDKAAKLIDETLASRPDLAARAAEVRASEAAIRKARADFLPEIKLQGQYAYSTFGYDANDGKVHGRFTEDINGYSALLVAKWDLFDGFERLERLRRKIRGNGNRPGRVGTRPPRCHP